MVALSPCDRKWVGRGNQGTEKRDPASAPALIISISDCDLVNNDFTVHNLHLSSCFFRLRFHSSLRIRIRFKLLSNQSLSDCSSTATSVLASNGKVIPRLFEGTTHVGPSHFTEQPQDDIPVTSGKAPPALASSVMSPALPQPYSHVDLHHWSALGWPIREDLHVAEVYPGTIK
ncbi:hypothetical protein HPP92_028929 [Vanilla planifolia]|uniref:Uncharacterized protein n=1 Tax=Vanilla planifolia TaxID=51239 RepID=A0A835P495_VANPL|nr:hypothetical protein HPP92_028929 [Vanilla planifolia]KAG0446260.1 hypothetical protein HPP92_028919 [Vanilla planifolia]